MCRQGFAGREYSFKDSRVKVSLIDLDVNSRRRPFPNLALMKLSTYYTQRGYDVVLNFPLAQADMTFASCVFTWSATPKALAQLPPDAHIGGSGIDMAKWLPADVEHSKPDYDLYGVTFSLGFTSRGCIRKCPWCNVPEKEGGIEPWTRIYEFWDRRHRLILLLDNNLLAASNWRQTLGDIIGEDLWVYFNKGLDIRLVNEEVVDYLCQLKAKQFRFSFDNLALEAEVRAGVKLLTDAGINSRRLSFYVLYGFGRDRTAVKRIRILEKLNVDIYPMEYRGPDGKHIARVHEVIPGKFFRGPRQNIKKMLRLKGRLLA